MELEDSPPLEDFAQGLPPSKAKAKSARKKIRPTIIFLSAVLAILVLVSQIQSRMVLLTNGSGTITGMVLDARGRPQVAEIIVERTKLVVQTDANGRFVVHNVPEGNQLLVVARDGVGVEYSIIAEPGDTVDIGTVQVVTTEVALP